MVVKVFIPILVVLLVNLTCSGMGRSMIITKEEELDTEKQLKVLKKHPVKSVKDIGGNMFDCIDINKQPALEHPLLKNHKVQTVPTLLPKGALEKTTSQPKMSVTPSVDCPKGTVPIRRIRKEGLIRARRLASIHPHSLVPGLSRAFVGARAYYVGDMYGAKGWMNLINPTVEGNQSVYSIISVDSNTDSDFNTIQAGWTVSPELYGDSKTRFFTYWQIISNGKLEGCYNVYCPGFVHVDNSFPLDLELPEVSSYDGERFEIQVAIVQDQSTKDWWLTIPSNSKKIGYWPSSIVADLTNGANHIYWGGMTRTSPGGKSPPMGFGNFPDGFTTRSGYFRQCRLFNKEGQESVPSDTDVLVDHDLSCYSVLNGDDKKDPTPHSFTYGGPGGLDCSKQASRPMILI